ncbi:hypothetical protein JCM19233_4459 [Vibrio astriarenae]|nr:hypothetical protein JCM19233_4459 [Vibrio sp. C7]
MRHGWLIALVVSLLWLSPVNAGTIEITQQTAYSWMSDERSQNKASELLQQLQDNKVDSVKFAIERLAMPQQEVVKYLLLTDMEQSQVALSTKMALFVDAQRSLRPTYQVIEQGDGYEFSAPAFNYPATATRLINRWKIDQKTLDVVLQAERGELVLRDYLTGDEVQLKTREDLLIQELSSLSEQAIEVLVEQITVANINAWLPRSRVMVNLARQSRSDELYRLLWLMKADTHSQRELERLSQESSSFAYQQVMAATNNPSLKSQALQQLARVKPMPEDVRSFLVMRMTIEEDAPIVARELVDQGYSQWLEELMATNGRVRANAINGVLAK